MLKLNDKYLLNIEQDDCAENPLEFENWFESFVWNDSFGLGTEKNPYDTMSDFVDAYCGAGTGNKAYSNNTNLTDLTKELTAMFDKQGFYLYPIDKFEHSQVQYAIGVSNGWDNSFIGFILVNKDIAKKTLAKASYKDVERELDQVLDQFSDYANGYVFSYTLMDMEQNELDTCSGFIGFDYDKNGLMDYVNGNLDHKTTIDDWTEAQERVIYF